MNSSTRLAAFSCFCLLLAFLCLLWGCDEKKTPAAPSPVKVRYQTVVAEQIILTRELPGRVSAFRVSEVRPQISGILQKRFFEEGAEVEAGQVLYQIDPALYQAAYNNAKANLRKAMANEEAARLLAERYTRLAKANAVSVQERDDAKAAYHQLRAEIEAAREALESAAINLSYTRITAPVSGCIGRSFVTEGALVTQNQTQALATIQQLSPVYVDVTQSSVQLMKIRQALSSGLLQAAVGNAARVRLYLEDGTPYRNPGSEDWFEGELLFSDITVEESTGTVILRARFDNPEGLLLPGMFVRAVLTEGVLDNAILIPQRSIARDVRNRPQVFVLTPRQGQSSSPPLYEVSVRTVRIDRDHGGRWLLADGLSAGELLLVDGLQKVRPGQLVSGQPLETDSPAKSARMPAVTQDGR